MKKLLLTSLISAFVCAGTVNAAPVKEPVSASNVASRLNGLKSGETKEYLGNFVKACMAKDWASCHLAWFELKDSGLQFVVTHEDGFNYSKWMYVKNPEATAIYDFVIDGLSYKTNADAWDIGVTPDKMYKDILTYVPARYALFDPGMRAALIEVLQSNLGTYNVDYNVSQSMSTEREEWYRLLALSFMSRKDVTNTYKVLEALNKYGKIKHSTQGYNELNLAIQSYFQKTGVIK